MNTIIGRITADAQVKEVSEGREVVTFTIAQNDRYKVKGAQEMTESVNYFNCSYWMGTGVATHLKKGMLVEANGRIGLDVWKDGEGEARGALTLHVQSLQLHSKAENPA